MGDHPEVGMASAAMSVVLAAGQLKLRAGLMRSRARGPIATWTRRRRPAHDQALPHHPDPLRTDGAPRGRPGSAAGGAARLARPLYRRRGAQADNVLTGSPIFGPLKNNH